MKSNQSKSSSHIPTSLDLKPQLTATFSPENSLPPVLYSRQISNSSNAPWFKKQPDGIEIKITSNNYWSLLLGFKQTNPVMETMGLI